MRLIDADALINELNNSHYPGAPYIDAGISIAIGKVCDAPTIEPEPQIIYPKAGYIMSLHKEYGCTLTRAEEAHNKALEYLRDKAMMQG